MILLEGKQTAQTIKSQAAQRASEFLKNHGRKPGLAVVLVGDDPASKVYVGHKIKTCQELGIESFQKVISATTTQDELNHLINTLNTDESVDAILVQSPLPKHLSFSQVLDRIDPSKDADGLTPHNVGLAWSGRQRVVPCTPAGIIELLKHYQISLERKHVCVIGRSDIVGKPMAQLLLQNNATVTICHSKTKSLEDITKQADIVVCAIGKRNYFTKEFFDRDAVVIDVGIHRLEEGLLCGDVFFKDVKDSVRALTPVPGGVGPLTIAMLMQNTVTLAELRKKKDSV